MTLRLVAGPARFTEVGDVIRWLRREGPRIVAVDSPRSPAPVGDLSRQGERQLVKKKVCGIRYTPNEAALNANGAYYAWIRNGFALYQALEEDQPTAGWEPIECFPTATWSRLGGPKRWRSRSRWSGEILDRVDLEGLPSRMNQDARDSLGAALTARLYDLGQTEEFGEIVVPVEDAERYLGMR